jgi:capsular polysaccharide biosynthesis protein
MRTAAPLRTVTGALRHFWWLLLAMTLIGVVAAGTLATKRPPSFQGTAVLNLDTSQASNQGFDLALQADQFLSQRYIQMATSQPVLQQVCAAAKPRCDPVSLARRVSASDSRGAGMIQVNVTAPSAAEAAALANAVAETVIAQNNQQVDNRIKPQRDLLQQNLKLQNDRVQQIRDQLSAAQRGTSDAAVANAIAPLLADLNQAQAQATTTAGQLQQLAVEEARVQNSLVLTQRATPPSKPIDPNLVIYTLVGFVAGLLAGFLAALVAEMLDDRIRDSGQLAEASGSPLVLEAGLRGRDRTGQREATAYSLAYASMVARHDPVRAVLVVASAYGDRVDDVGVGLATAAAQWGHRVLVIQSYHPPKGKNGDSAVAEVTSRVVIEAASPENNGKQLVSNDGFDLIVACTPPPGYSPNAMSFVSSTDLAIVVATRGRSKSRDARWAADLLRHTGVQVAGAVLLDRNGRGKRRPAHLAPLPGAAQEAEAITTAHDGGEGLRSGPPAPVGGPEAWAGPARRTGGRSAGETAGKSERGQR